MGGRSYLGGTWQRLYVILIDYTECRKGGYCSLKIMVLKNGFEMKRVFDILEISMPAGKES